MIGCSATTSPRGPLGPRPRAVLLVFDRFAVMVILGVVALPSLEDNRLHEVPGMATKKKKKGQVGYAPNKPTKEIIAYRNRLTRLVASCRPAIKAAVGRFEKEMAKRDDGTASRTGRGRVNHVDAAVAVTRALAGVKAQLDTIVTKARPGLVAQGVGKRTSAFAVDAADKSVRGIVTIDRDKTISGVDQQAFVRRNVKLIKSIPKQLFADVQAELTDAWNVGRDRAVLARNIEERFDVTENRAKLIARDQVSTLFSQVNQKRQRDLGITRYEWDTAQDERVRGDPGGLYPDAVPSHYDRQGEVFSYDDPPEGGHPGEAINCRCVAVPIIDDVDDDEET